MPYKCRATSVWINSLRCMIWHTFLYSHRERIVPHKLFKHNMGVFHRHDTTYNIYGTRHKKTKKLPFRRTFWAADPDVHRENLFLSGRPDLNWRPLPWQGSALPTELLPHGSVRLQRTAPCKLRLFMFIYSIKRSLNLLPECDLRYFSNRAALLWLTNPANHISLTGSR